MLERRAVLLGVLGLGIALGCGSTSSRLKTVDAGSGSGPILFEVQNGTDVPINNLYLAKTEAVSAAISAKKVEPGSAAEQELWGIDYLTKAALEVNGRIKIPVEQPGAWDVRVVDRDSRYQHVAGLKLAGGGRYILELGEGGWRVQR